MRSGTSWWTALRTREDEEEGEYNERSRLLAIQQPEPQTERQTAPTAGPSTYAEAAAS